MPTDRPTRAQGPRRRKPGGKGARPRSGPPRGGMIDRSLAPRVSAIETLDHVLRGKRMLSQLPADHGLAPAEAARANRLVLMVLRHLEPLDTLIARYAERAPALPTRLILRLAAAEMLIAGEEPHGVVHSAVTLAKAGRRTERAAGMINAVLRRIAEDGATHWADHVPQKLPGWIAGPVKKRHGAAVRAAIEAAHEAGAPLDLTPRAEDAVLPDGAQRLPTGSFRFAEARQVSDLPGYASGDWWVQDAAAALPVRLFGDLAGKRALDLCAAPGGKTLQLAAAGAEVTALDVSDTRLDRLRANLARTGLSARIVIGDALEHQGQYDAVLLDAPCTASGTIRRHPDLPFVKSWKEVEPLTRLQMRLLDHAITLLAPGGRLVFCTCSLLPVEGEHQITAALKRHPDLRVLPADPKALGGLADWASAEGGLRLRPDHWADLGGLDGFYMACLARDASPSDASPAT